MAYYNNFAAPIAAFDCGSKCSPYNERGVPFCCDTRHSVPTAYQAEWQYLQENTDLWHIWESGDLIETSRLRAETPADMILIECQGHQKCQRDFRSMTCRAFPFFPYISSEDEFLGLSYYWEYEERCWVINNLDVVTSEYREEFVRTYDELFATESNERNNFAYHAEIMRKKFDEFERQIPLIHRDGNTYLIDPNNERMQIVSPQGLPKFGPYEIAAMLPFPDEE
ncbi:MAG: hypothetical protein ISR58_20675 [Anaerolineales bacterium]|nr:hypothetical protein [Chloroflexota bacterium]MBL6983604.1 hypothetical protein [Anaerolineales bacterium]